MEDTSIKVPLTETRRMGQDEEDLSHLRHVRLYSYSPGRASLQIRSKGRIVWGDKAKVWQCFSSAYLDLVAAVRLRDALNEWIGEQN